MEDTPNPVEEVRDPAAVLEKNRQLLAQVAGLKARASQLEDLGRDLGLADDDLADPAATIARRAEERKAADVRTRTIREATLRTLAAEERTPHGGVDAVIEKVLSDPRVKVEGDKVLGLADALAKIAPKRTSPGFPDTSKRPEDAKPITWEELQGRGPEAVTAFALARPETYAKLREDFERRLARPDRRG